MKKHYLDLFLLTRTFITFYDYLLTVRGDKQFSFIFTNVLKRSHHFISSKFFLFTNGMQENQRMRL